jgi:hypothetical protein
LLAQAPPESEPATREAGIMQLQTEKAVASRPPKPDKAEVLVRRAEELLLIDSAGFFPSFDPVYQGGSLTLGGGYRRFFGDNRF